MDRDQLLREIQWTKEALGELQKLEWELWKKRGEWSKLSDGPLYKYYSIFYVRAYIGCALFLLLVWVLLGGILDSIGNFLTSDSGWFVTLLVGAALYLVIPIFIYYRTLSYFNKKLMSKPSYQEQKEMALDAFNEAKQKRDQHLQYIELNSEIPSAYRNTSVLDTFENYLRNYRAETLKECINLYEAEATQMKLQQTLQQNNEKLMEANRKLQVELKKTREKLSDIESKID